MSSKWNWFLFAFFLLVLSPYYTNGYYFDDGTHHSYLRASLKASGEGFLSYLFHALGTSFREGRIFPVRQIISNLSFYLIDNLPVYRFLDVLSTIANLIFLTVFVRDVSGRKGLPEFLTGIIFLFFQLRSYHDPIAAYGFLMQVSFFLRLGAIYFLWLSIEKGSSKLYATSLIFYTLSILDYEPALGTLPVIFGVLFLRVRTGTRASWRAFFPFLLMTIAYLLSAYLLRARVQSPYIGTSLGSLSSIPGTYLIQMIAAFPLSFFFNLPEYREIIPELVQLMFKDIRSLLVLFGAGVIIFRAVLKAAEEKPEENRDLLYMIAGAWILIPPVFVALSARYQVEIQPGLAYLPIYYSYYGAALLFGLLILSGFRRLRTKMKNSLHFKGSAFAFSFLMGHLIAFTFSLNTSISRSLDTYWRHPRDLLAQAVDQGLTQDLEPGAQIVTVEDYVWLPEDFVKLRVGGASSVRKIHTIPRKELAQLVGQNLSARKIYFLSFLSQKDQRGWAALGKVQEIIPSTTDQSGYKFLVSDPKIYVKSPSAQILAASEVVNSIYSVPGYIQSWIHIPISAMTLLKHGDKWMMSRLKLERTDIAGIYIEEKTN